MNLWSNPPWHVPSSVARVKRRLTAVWNCWPGKRQFKLRWFANKTFLWTFHKQIWLKSKLFNDYHCDLECLDVLDWSISKMFVSGFLDGFVAGWIRRWMFDLKFQWGCCQLLPEPGFHCKFLSIELTTGFSLALGDDAGHRVMVRVVVGKSGCSHSRRRATMVCLVQYTWKGKCSYSIFKSSKGIASEAIALWHF